MLDITNDNLFTAGADWYGWQYMPLMWKNSYLTWLLRCNMVLRWG